MLSVNLHRSCVRPLRHKQQRLVTCSGSSTFSSSCSSSSSSSSSSRSPASQQENQQHSKRQVLIRSAALFLAVQAGKAAADVAEDLERQLPGPLPAQQTAELPKPYQRTMRKLVAALRSSIEAEAGGAKEAEVRRRADPAKELVREWVGKWQDNAAVAGNASHDEMRGALSELGRFYQAHGPRSRLSEEVKGRVLAHLAAAEAALPAEEKSLLGF